ncbi:glycosyltransferase family 2 protein [Candidatus Protochlamydia phocaeensis]|uniref:glycosyltransferase family 2 protein n=1 Tax=Candidatus Protochlamydia phocaeensis TaxID=1414722 RepID=UPI0008382D46|nr:glycosyltransferase family 2 protein [Candidatus Protochlamydia phocaeensis]
MSECVDILLATYQGAEYVEEQIKSILLQNYPHFHLWIRDDGSSDETVAILTKIARTYPHQVTLLPSQENLGVKGNFSELMKVAKAPYILFADQDDYWLPHKIETSLACMQAMEQSYGKHLPLLVHTDLKVVGKDLAEIAPSFWRYTHLNPHHIALNRLLAQNVVTGCTMLINRRLLELACPVPEKAIMHDWWIALVATCFGHIDYVDQPTMLYRQHGANDTGAKNYGLFKFLNEPNAETQKKSVCACRTHKQACLLLERYDHLLNSHQKALLWAYAELEYLPYLERKRQIIKHQFFKQGFLRNLKTLLAK